MDGCAGWNENNPQKCLGVTWVYDQTGPDGIPGGGQCYFYWDLADTENPQDQDSGQLVTSAPPTVYSKDQLPNI
jgi:hypothetical protein